ncbi:hypothetical protein GYMLUDRAFT_74528 [Collybiopsis luxurians FD-317 M1]|uniref:Uncharacterized protein n=1 Tax=Collybiopsis luxurians FD-317 M1 TaxID=944289 RepID=A0A0D0BUT3_9AGAR|nr:hypothetical protein GYMLUDRAFT_74528 [Collybiopsis luxurians FD-317 M1]
MSITNILTLSLSSTNPTSDIEVNSLSFPFLPTIRVPPPLILSEVPLRERRGFNQSIIIIPRPELPSESMPKPARGQLEPRAGALPRRRRAPSMKPVVIQPNISESKNFDFAISP